MKVYLADISNMSNESYLELLQMMPQSRIDKISRYKQDADKKRSLAAMALLINAAKYYGITNFDIVEESNGKPHFVKGTDLQFNLSHSGEKVMCTIDTHPVGCDIQEMGEIKLAVAKRFFSQEEYELISSLNSKEEKKEMFYRLWTLKEAYIKATGEGLSRELNSFSFDIELNSQKLIKGINTDGYVFFEGSIDNYRYAICSNNMRLEKKPITIEEIIF